MIAQDAKCINNGKKLNEAIGALNPLLAMSVGYTGGGKPPQVSYSDGEVKILLPLADSVDGFSLEELDIVDTNNAASSRYFMTSASSVSTYGTTTASTSGTPTGKQSSAPTNKDRNSLGGTPNDKNRDKLTTGGAPLDNGAGGVMPAGMVKPGLQAAKDNFDDTRPLAPVPKMAGMVKPGSQAAKDNFDDTRPRPGAPPRGGDGTGGGFPLGGKGKGAFGGGVDAFGNELYADGTRVTPGGRGDGTGGGFPLPGVPPPGRRDGTGGGGGNTRPSNKITLSSDPSARAQIVADKTRRDNQAANKRIYEKAAAIKAANKKKKEDASAKAAAYKARVKAGNLKRTAKGAALRKKAAARVQSNIKAASSPVRSSQIATLKKQLTDTVRELANVDNQIARDRANKKIHSPSSPLMKKRQQLEDDRKRISSKMTSL